MNLKWRRGRHIQETFKEPPPGRLREPSTCRSGWVLVMGREGVSDGEVQREGLVIWREK